jgi:hypothetical protein
MANLRNVAAVGLIVSLVSALPALADEYPFDVAKKYPASFLYGSVCKPHDCAGNSVAFLLAKGGGEAFGELSSNTLGAKNRYFGTPDAEVRGLLDKLLKE